ncbi:NUDIX domain-containing protein [Ancylobacter sp. 6x-1]|uniref:ADP-ribose pyrophosphatase n=2 Tax=Ancylobacter crimeensis TaxID=2579147 RepID=A0ABT0DAX7_9HYPH|nr:NUDIX domain-containing protein [Ancylobacter crimeensis]MCK0197112.1 NUDIX domain-containing protein [Ancylobacter crimeensis]
MPRFTEQIADTPVEVELSSPRLLGDGFRPYDRFDVTLAGRGGTPVSYDRDVLRVGNVAAVLAFDPVLDCFVLIRQFRLPAHLATGRGGSVEIVAGGIEPGEAPDRAAIRECIEEIGVAPRALLPIYRFMPSPGCSDEYANVFLALVDAATVPCEAGAASEQEHTRPLLVRTGDALAALAAGTIGNSFLMTALQWFALNRERADVRAFVEERS